MKKIELLKDIIDDLDRRKREISNLISIVTSIDSMDYYYFSSGKKRKNPNFPIKKDIDIIIKSGIVIFYSHWEGFVKDSGKKFLNYLSGLNFTRKELEKCYLDYFILKHEKNLSVVLSTVVDDGVIRIYGDMLDDLRNLNDKELKGFFAKIGFEYKNFLNSLESHMESITGLTRGGDFKQKKIDYKRKNHFLSEYLHLTNSQINLDKTLENILQVNRHIPNDKSLLFLRNSIAHGGDVAVDINRLISLGNISMMLLDVFKESFEVSLKDPKYI